MERTQLPLLVKVFATDIDDEALETASRGVYGDHIRKDVPAGYLNKYFIREGDSYRVSANLRKVVVFANHNLLKDPPFSKLDLITCRNMFIYLSAELQNKALRRFHFALNVGSYLMLGPSEAIGVLKDSVDEVNRKWRIYRCNIKARMSETIMVPLENRTYMAGAWQQSAKTKVSKSLMEAFKDTITQDRKIAGIFIDAEYNIRQATGNFKHFLGFREESFHFNLLKLVSQSLAVTLGICVRKAVSLNDRVVMKHIIDPDAGKNSITIIAKPFGDKSGYGQQFICVVLEEDEPVHREQALQINPSEANYERILELEHELRETRENLQAIIEETESANEEAQSSNEELISTNEELQSTNEELQSLNEELHTVSGEHQLKIKELLELNDDLNNYFNTSHIGQIQLDRKFIIRRFSPSVKQMVNLIESDIGRSINDITTNIQGINLAQIINDVMHTGKSIETEASIRDSVFLIVHIVPYIRHTGETDGVSITFIDVTEMRRLSSIVEGIFHSSANGITAKRAIRDANGNVTDLEYIAANEAMVNIFGKTPQELVGKSMLKTVPEKGQFFEAYKKVLETGEPMQLEFHRTEDDRWFDMVAVKMLDGVVTTFTDITEKRRAANTIAENFETLQHTSRKLEESNLHLERSNFDLLQFASVASHDLKEPLRKIQAFGNILQAKISEKLSEPELGYLNKIISASGRMQTLIEDVLTLSKLSNSELHKETTDLNRIVSRICDDLDIAITEKNAVIEVGDLPSVNAVPGQMRQLFQNLIANALKFNNKSEPVVRITEHTLTAEQLAEYGIDDKDFICISLQDNGIGFEDEYREKIFGIFQRLHGRNYEGTGIGLSIAKKIVEMHGGIIDAKGVLNEGATFYIVLPLNGVSAPAQETSAVL
jgi:two-component system CheB/CheR fusion protein